MEIVYTVTSLQLTISAIIRCMCHTTCRGGSSTSSLGEGSVAGVSEGEPVSGKFFVGSKYAVFDIKLAITNFSSNVSSCTYQKFYLGGGYI